MKATDEEILRVVDDYRNGVGGKHGPPSLEILAELLTEETGEPITKAAVSLRVARLIQQGLLYGLPSSTGTMALTLAVTDRGKELIHEQVLESTGEASG